MKDKFFKAMNTERARMMRIRHERMVYPYSWHCATPLTAYCGDADQAAAVLHLQTLWRMFNEQETIPVLRKRAEAVAARLERKRLLVSGHAQPCT